MAENQEENHFGSTVESLFKGMDSFISTKTVVGDAVTVGNTIILPMVDVSFGVGAGAFEQEKKNNGAGGMGGRITPSAVLVIQDNNVRLVNVKSQETANKLCEMIPDLINRFTKKGKEAGADKAKYAGNAEKSQSAEKAESAEEEKDAP